MCVCVFFFSFGEGYEKALAEALKLLPTMVSYELGDVKDVDEVSAALKCSIASKLYGLESIIAPLVANACISILPSNIDTFAVENVRVAKIPGGSVRDSSVVHGAVLMSNAEGTIKHGEQTPSPVFFLPSLPIPKSDRNENYASACLHVLL